MQETILKIGRQYRSHPVLDGGRNLYCDSLRSPNGSPFRLAPGDLSPPRVRNPDSPFQSSDTDYETPLAQRIVRRLKRKRSGIIGTNRYFFVVSPVFWIRIHLIRIRVHHFRLNTNLHPIWIQGFDDKKLNKLRLKKKNIFLGSKTTIYLSQGLHKGRQVIEEVFSSQKMKFVNFYCAFECNLKRCKRTGRRKNLRRKNEKTREYAWLENLLIPCKEEIRKLFNPHFSFTRGQVKLYF
jgi:hypothetical protein